MKSITITNKTGVHARPAGMLIKEAQKFDSEINLIRDGKAVNAKSIMAILGMGICEGDQIVIEATGSDSTDAVSCIYSILEKINQE